MRVAGIPRKGARGVDLTHVELGCRVGGGGSRISSRRRSSWSKSNCLAATASALSRSGASSDPSSSPRLRMMVTRQLPSLDRRRQFHLDYFAAAIARAAIFHTRRQLDDGMAEDWRGDLGPSADRIAKLYTRL
jgi:hypothetical protein